MKVNRIIEVICGKRVSIANHPLFGVVRDSYAEKYNNFVEKMDLDDKSIVELRELLEASGAQERLGYLEIYKMGYCDGEGSRS